VGLDSRFNSRAKNQWRRADQSAVLELLPDFMNGRTGTVKIHNVTGEIEEERTYPRSEDPLRSKG
jgi:hypothetical protein